MLGHTGQQNAQWMGAADAALVLAVNSADDQMGTTHSDVGREICTDFWAKPIPMRQFDWSAWFDGDEPNDYGQMLMGYGRTEKEAIQDLLDMARDRE